MIAIRTLALSFCLVLLLVEAAPAQERRSGANCSGCSIEAWRTLTVTGGEDGLEGDPRSAAVMTDRRILWIAWGSGRPVYIADLGQDELSPVMRVGEGPGEVRRAIGVHRSWNDTLFVLDNMLRRVSVLSPTGEFVTSFRLDVSALSPDFIQLRDGRFVVAASVASRERAGFPLHLVGRDGSVLKSFGESGGVTRMLSHDDLFKQERRLALGDDSTFFSVRTGSYVIEKWTRGGALLGAWDVAPDWFSPKDRVMAASHEEAPPPRVMGIQVDRQGRVWTLVLRADDNWSGAVEAPKRPPAVMNVISYNGYLDTQIEVFDGATMERLASRRLGTPLGGFVAPGVAHSVEAIDGEDSPIVHLWRVHLKVP